MPFVGAKAGHDADPLTIFRDIEAQPCLDRPALFAGSRRPEVVRVDAVEDGGEPVMVEPCPDQFLPLP